MKIVLFILSFFLSNLVIAGTRLVVQAQAKEYEHDEEYQRALAKQMKEQPLEQARLGAESLALQHDAEYQKALAKQQAEQTQEQINQQHVLGIEASSSYALNCATVQQGPCNHGYVDVTHGHHNWWACGVNCVGGKYWTDGTCGCACKKKDIVCPNKIPCHGQSRCNNGYQSRIPVHELKWWACGVNCPGGKYWTDSTCGCACVANTQCQSLCYPKGPCNAGYMDKTNGNYKWWACGVNCPGGKYWTDNTCGCACIPRNNCPVVSETPLWSKLGFQAKSMITENTGTTMFALGGGLIGITGLMFQVRKWTSSNDAHYELLNTELDV